MLWNTYPKCCHAYILSDFGYGHASEDDAVQKAHRNTPFKRPDKDAVKKFVVEAIGGLRANSIQVIFACPTNHQPEAIQALTELGFCGAPEEELQASKQHYTFYPINQDRAGYDYNNPITIDHIMVPMFLLIPNVQVAPDLKKYFAELSVPEVLTIE